MRGKITDVTDAATKLVYLEDVHPGMVVECPRGYEDVVQTALHGSTPAWGTVLHVREKAGVVNMVVVREQDGEQVPVGGPDIYLIRSRLDEPGVDHKPSQQQPTELYGALVEHATRCTGAVVSVPALHGRVRLVCTTCQLRSDVAAVT